MRVLLFVCIIICLLSTTSELKCYACDDYYNDYYEYPNLSFQQTCEITNKTTECHSYNNNFCVTFEYPYCIKTGCDFDQECKSVGTHEIVDPNGRKVTFTCCQGDLCNSPENLTTLIYHQVIISCQIYFVLHF